jgi:acyl-CoA reductase-like NAD-dependent aldehyde dehydrogenase
MYPIPSHHILGVFQIVHGGAEVVNAMCDHPKIAAVSFVGSSKVAEIVSKRCHAVNKRVLVSVSALMLTYASINTEIKIAISA